VGAGTAGATILGSAACSRPEIVPNLPSRISFGDDMNVVLIIVDSLRKDHVGVYGNDWIETPNLDALARDSLRFERAYPESIPTICARRSIHTGIRTWPFKDWKPPKGEDIILQGWQPIPENQTTLAEILKEQGYYNMFVTDNMHQYKASYNFQRGFDAFRFIRGQTTDNYHPLGMTQPSKAGEALLKGNVPAMTSQMLQYFANVNGRSSEEDWFTPQVFGTASEFAELASEGSDPFFMVIDSYDPHEPWDPPEKYLRIYDDEPYNGREPFSVVYGPSDYLTERELERMRARYAAEVTMMDHWLGRFLDKMEELDLFESTLLILLSDHGHLFGEHGITGKPAFAIYPELVDIPFFIRHPEGKSAGRTSDYHASTHDIAPTVLGSLGVGVPEEMQGQDLSVLLDGEKPDGERAHITAGYHDHVWARDDRYAILARNDGSEAKLFELKSDPQMNRDVAASNPGVARRLFDDYVLGDAGGPLPTY
jgi:arylsulfatase A-like enzyme